MARHLPESLRLFRWQVLAFPILMGTVAWASLREVSPAIPSLPASPRTNIQASSTSTRILLGHKTPNQDRDEAFVYDEVQNTIVATSTSSGWRIPKEMQGRIRVKNDSGVWAYESVGWDAVTLRTSRGNPYHDPTLIGELDRDHAIIRAINSDHVVLLLVARNGSIRELTVLPEGAEPIGVQEGRVWVTQSVPQEGIEMPPRGPSSVWSIDVRGATSTTIQDERTETVIAKVLTRGANIALISEQGDMRVRDDRGLSAPIPGKPLLWLADQRLLFLHNRRLCFLLPSGATTCPLEAPADLSWAMPLTPSL